MRWPAQAALALIGAYQRWISPHKGFRCAHAVQTGRRGCSTLGARAIRRRGLWNGLGMLACRLDACALSHEQLRTRRHTRPHAQSGSCDLDCGGCDAFDSCDVAECACDTLDCADCFDRRKDSRRCGSSESSADAARRRIEARQNRRKAASPPPAPVAPTQP